MTLALTAEQSQAVIAHALSEHPRECVGLIVCSVITGECRVVPLRNTSRNAEHEYATSARDVTRMYRELDRNKEYVHTVYHSHTHRDATPSQVDIDNAWEDDAHWLIIATDHGRKALRAWRIWGGRATEEPVVITRAAGPTLASSARS